MKGVNTYFRAVTDYRKNTDKQTDCVKIRTQIAEACRENDKISNKRIKCKIKTDWVEEIEKGLVFVEKALKEERQFIRSNGEVVPIEKVKHVSKSSVEYLARHSELITRETEGEDLTPDKLFTVEKLTDYSVYENRFLYMMLCYLRDFISLRYSHILEAVNTYTGSAKVEKEIITPKGEFKFSMTLSEVNRGDEYLSEHNEAKDILDRIDLLLKTVMLFLSFPLMQEVKKSPMLKPPITKTNVLKMNHNFKGALALYEYISAYDEDGYSLYSEINEINGFKNAVAEDFAELAREASFLAYEYGLGIRDYLKEEFEKEEQLRKEEEQRKLEAQIEAMRKRVTESGMGMEEYILMLEKRNKALLSDSEELDIVRRDNEKLTLSLHDKEMVIGSLNSEIRHLSEVYEQTIAAHADEITRLNEAHEAEIQGINQAHAKQIEEIVFNHEKEKQAMQSLFEEEKKAVAVEAERRVSEANASCEVKIAELNESYGKRLSDAQTECNRLSYSVSELTGNKTALETQVSQMQENALVLKARILGLKQKNAAFDGSEEFDDEENFNDLEEQYKAFKKFFDGTWRKAKKEIRKRARADLKEGKFDKKTDDSDITDQEF